jgi:purine-cytosine permease-like protein
LATGTIFIRLGGIDPNLAMIIGFLLAVSLTMYGGILGHSVIMRLQKYLTLITVTATILYIALTIDNVKWDLVSEIPNGTMQGFIGALIFGITGIGLGWVNSAADYSRYLPRSTSSRSVVGWTIFGASIVPIFLVTYGALLAGSDQKLAEAIASDPIGALTTLLPTWYLAIFALIAILGLVGGSILNLYSSGLTLISTGLPMKRYVAVTLDGLIMLAGSIYIVWIADNFFYPFQGFLITLGVPVATWSAIFITDILLRRNPFVERDLFSASGRYGVWNWRPLSVMAVGTLIGWGFVTNTFASWLSWQGYLLFLIGGKEGPWAFANVGVIFALFIGFLGHFLLSHRKIRAQDRALS